MGREQRRRLAREIRKMEKSRIDLEEAARAADELRRKENRKWVKLLLCGLGMIAAGIVMAIIM